jgi:hypothetical protein
LFGVLEVERTTAGLWVELWLDSDKAMYFDRSLELLIPSNRIKMVL